MINTTCGAQDSRVVGGTQLISLKLADQLGQRVPLGSPVSEIVQGPQGVLVNSARVQVRCQQVIVAMAPNDADRITVTPGLPVRRRNAPHPTSAHCSDRHTANERNISGVVDDARPGQLGSAGVCWGDQSPARSS